MAGFHAARPRPAVAQAASRSIDPDRPDSSESTRSNVDITRKDQHLYELVADDLKQKMLEDYFGPDNKIPNYLELAAIYDVSMSTIRRAMKLLNEQEVLVSRVGKGTFPTRKFMAGNGSRPNSRTGKVGLLIRDIEGPYFSGIYRALADRADEAKARLILTVSRDFHQQEDALLRTMLAQEVDGLLLTTRRKSVFGTRIFELLTDKQIPAVILHDVYDARLPIVDVDNYRGGALAACHLLERVDRKFCVVVGEHGFKPDDLRLQGFLDTLREKGVDVEDRCLVYRFSFGTEGTAFDEGYKVGHSLAVKHLDIGGVFLFNDLIAMGFQKAMLERGIRIPEDIAVIGFDDIERCSEARVPLTTIRVPRYEIGQHAFETLQNIITGVVAPKPTKRLLEPQLVVRDST